jgi:hypothetical protein
MAPVDSIIYFLINIIYFFDNFLRKDISPTFRTRMRDVAVARVGLALQISSRHRADRGRRPDGVVHEKSSMIDALERSAPAAPSSAQCWSGGAPAPRSCRRSRRSTSAARGARDDAVPNAIPHSTHVYTHCHARYYSTRVPLVRLAARVFLKLSMYLSVSTSTFTVNESHAALRTAAASGSSYRK